MFHKSHQQHLISLYLSTLRIIYESVCNVKLYFNAIKIELFFLTSE